MTKLNPLIRKILIIAAPLILKKLFRGRGGKSIFKFVGLFLLAIIFLIWLLSRIEFAPPFQDSDVPVSESKESRQAESPDIRTLFEEQRSGVMVAAEGNVTRILSDDNEGSRHQRFIISVPNELSLLITHNIDLAPRVPIQVNDQISIYGQYEWNNKGGLIHWTHHDPKNLRPGGWIKHKNKKYE